MALAKLMTEQGNLMKMRALGYSQQEIAERFGVSQAAISQRISAIRKVAEKKGNDDNAFWELLLGLGAVYLLAKIFEEVK